MAARQRGSGSPMEDQRSRASLREGRARAARCAVIPKRQSGAESGLSWRQPWLYSTTVFENPIGVSAKAHRTSVSSWTLHGRHLLMRRRNSAPDPQAAGIGKPHVTLFNSTIRTIKLTRSRHASRLGMNPSQRFSLDATNPPGVWIIFAERKCLGQVCRRHFFFACHSVCH